MDVPTSEVGYNSAMPRREDHEVRKGHVGHWIKKNILSIHVNSVLSLPKRQLFSRTMTTRLILLKEVTDLCCEKHIKHKSALYNKFSTCLMLCKLEYAVTIEPSTAISIRPSLTKGVLCQCCNRRH